MCQNNKVFSRVNKRFHSNMLLDLQELRDYSLFEYYKQNKLQTYMKSDLRVRAVKKRHAETSGT